MVDQVRPTLSLRLTSRTGRDGEIPLSELAKVAKETQLVVTRIARGMMDDRTSGRPHKNITDATILSLIGLGAGSTVLEMALPGTTSEMFNTEDMPATLGEMALTALVESLDILAEDEPNPVLPVGIDAKAADDVDSWLSALGGYSQIGVTADLSQNLLQTSVRPREARTRLRSARSQPSVPYISADNQALISQLIIRRSPGDSMP